MHTPPPCGVGWVGPPPPVCGGGWVGARGMYRGRSRKSKHPFVLIHVCIYACFMPVRTHAYMHTCIHACMLAKTYPTQNRSSVDFAFLTVVSVKLIVFVG